MCNQKLVEISLIYRMELRQKPDMLKTVTARVCSVSPEERERTYGGSRLQCCKRCN